MQTKKFLCIYLCISTFTLIAEGHVNLDLEPKNGAFDTELYENVIDTKQCLVKLTYLTTSPFLLAKFLDAGMRVPKSILLGNNIDLGSYHECLGINEQVQKLLMEGKYCMIKVPLNQDFSLINKQFKTSFDSYNISMNRELVERLEELDALKSRYINILGGDLGHHLRTISINQLEGLNVRLAVCIPKACSTKLFINTLLPFLKYSDEFCRIKGDKPWVPADTIAVTVFTIIGLLTIMSTSLDVWYTGILRKDPKTINAVYRSFSVYNNTRRLVTYTANPNAIECLDGIRVLAMLWVIIGHSFVTQPLFYNNIDLVHWIASSEALWIQAAPMTVDTFFMLSGLLIVYTTAGKFTSVKLLKNLHLFYLNRLLRMFPILATVVLLEASLFHRWLDGPMWKGVATNAERCRTYWWTTLLYIQNYVSPRELCIGPAWYLAVDVQLHILSPLVLVGVLSGIKYIAWATMATTLVGVVTSAGIYCYMMGFPASFTGLGPSIEERYNYFIYYYINTLTRASPFIVGMMYGYLLHVCRRRHIRIPPHLNTFLWVFAMSILVFVAWAVLPTLQADWDNSVLDILYNTFLRPMWAAALGWIVFACAKGYGGPVNWLLSLQMWKLPSRVSYAMYLFHFSIIMTINGTRTEPIWFSPQNIVFLFCGYLLITFIVAFIATVLIDSPVMVLIKSSMERGSRRG